MNQESVVRECDSLSVKFRHHRDMPLPWRFSFWMGKRWAQSTFLTIRPFIYTPDDVKAPFEHWQTIAHELVRWRQQKSSNNVWWLAQYAFSQAFRWQAEREAYLVTVRFGADPLEIAEALRADYGIRCVSVLDMAKWLKENA